MGCGIRGDRLRMLLDVLQNVLADVLPACAYPDHCQFTSTTLSTLTKPLSTFDDLIGNFRLYDCQQTGYRSRFLRVGTTARLFLLSNQSHCLARYVTVRNCVIASRFHARLSCRPSVRGYNK